MRCTKSKCYILFLSDFIIIIDLVVVKNDIVVDVLKSKHRFWSKLVSQKKFLVVASHSSLKIAVA